MKYCGRQWKERLILSRKIEYSHREMVFNENLESLEEF